LSAAAAAASQVPDPDAAGVGIWPPSLAPGVFDDDTNVLLLLLLF
jgi:hypothetical protein